VEPGADFGDRTDFEDADRGFIGSLEPCVVRAPDGREIWNNDAWSFLNGDCPDTVNPSLWRQSQLTARQGLYEVTEGIYQIRGFDLSNMTVIESDHGAVVIDPLISAECASAALALYRKHRGNREVTGVVYTHAHLDHFGGVRGVYESEVPVVAATGFMEAVVAENVYAGTAMARRAVFMYGVTLPKSATGQVGAGLGATTSTGSVGIVPPTLEVTHTGQEEVIDGVRVRFQMTPGTECPVEMNVLFPERRALCMAENATHNLHNLGTLRGAVVRDPRMWSRYLDEAIELFCDEAEVAFASHHWPTWGRDRIVAYLRQQRDLYAYLHDQTLRLMNQGYTGVEIAEMMTMPPALEAAWHTRGYYGSVSHNVKAIYQRYLGWFDGNPSSLWEHPPVASANRYVECMGGVSEVVNIARRYADAGDLRFAAQLLKHAVFAGGSDAEAESLLAEIYERLGFGAENGTWRNFYLQGAAELRSGTVDRPARLSSSALVTALSIDQLFDAVAVRLNGPRCWEESFSIDWVFTDVGDTYRTELSNGVLVQKRHPTAGEAGLRLTLTKDQLLGLLGGRALDGVAADGDLTLLERLLSFVDETDPGFPIVTP
jgi:alkyl sulfatase BDS1-like metallo-beta-lactamase superfamily hydrolase